MNVGIIHFRHKKLVCNSLNVNAPNLGASHTYIMVFRVVSTKLTEEEHGVLLDVCNIIGCTPSNLIREAILKIINQEQRTVPREPNLLQTLSRELNTKPAQQRKEFPSYELAKILGVRIN